jgi:hypothetical protein
MFVVAGSVALVLLGVAGFFLLTSFTQESAVSGELETQKSSLLQLVQRKVHPGTDKINNIKATQEEQVRLKQLVLQPASQHFGLVSFTNTLEPGAFQLRLVNTVAELQRMATNANVTIPTNYAFSFSNLLRSLSIETNLLPKLSAQLSDVRGLSELLFRSKIHRLVSIQRTGVASNDTPDISDFLPKAISPIVTNDVVEAVVFPYRVTFVSQSAELARVLSELALSPECYMVKYLSVQPVSAAGVEGEEGSEQTSAAAQMMNRYGIPGGGGMSPALQRRYGMGGGGRYRGGGARPAPTPMAPVPMAPMAPAPTGVVLKEGPLQSTILIEVVKFAPGLGTAPKAAKPRPARGGEGGAAAPDAGAAPAPDAGQPAATPDAPPAQ